MTLLLFILGALFGFGFMVFVFGILNAKSHEPLPDHLEMVYNDGPKAIFYNKLTKLYEAHEKGEKITQGKSVFDVGWVIFD